MSLDLTTRLDMAGLDELGSLSLDMPLRCACEAFAQHIMRLQPHPLQLSESPAVMVDGYRADVPFRLLAIPAEVGLRTDISKVPEVATKVGQLAWANLHDIAGIETVIFTGYSARIGHSSLLPADKISQDIAEAFKQAGCDSLTIAPGKGPSGFYQL